ncbi:hypothetical protein H4R34_002407 [Dimargaris verticillata]|uniref:Uncharacterized protein n=1 Tax=Dimargaris verticillata TaxID=2761393 RepID=A0A9W8B825_9FUNG|nr:hypothetical protein H4R34_002407 [Dimargaris verticillata]
MSRDNQPRQSSPTGGSAGHSPRSRSPPGWLAANSAALDAAGATHIYVPSWLDTHAISPRPDAAHSDPALLATESGSANPTWSLYDESLLRVTSKGSPAALAPNALGITRASNDLEPELKSRSLAKRALCDTTPTQRSHGSAGSTRLTPDSTHHVPSRSRFQSATTVTQGLRACVLRDNFSRTTPGTASEALPSPSPPALSQHLPVKTDSNESPPANTKEFTPLLHMRRPHYVSPLKNADEFAHNVSSPAPSSSRRLCGVWRGLALALTCCLPNPLFRCLGRAGRPSIRAARQKLTLVYGVIGLYLALTALILVLNNVLCQLNRNFSWDQVRSGGWVVINGQVVDLDDAEYSILETLGTMYRGRDLSSLFPRFTIFLPQSPRRELIQSTPIKSTPGNPVMVAHCANNITVAQRWINAVVSSDFRYKVVDNQLVECPLPSLTSRNVDTMTSGTNDDVNDLPLRTRGLPSTSRAIALPGGNAFDCLDKPKWEKAVADKVLGDVRYTEDEVRTEHSSLAKSAFYIIDSKVYDLTNYLLYATELVTTGNGKILTQERQLKVNDTMFLNQDLTELLVRYPGQDISQHFRQLSNATESLDCLNYLFYVGTTRPQMVVEGLAFNCSYFHPVAWLAIIAVVLYHAVPWAMGKWMLHGQAARRRLCSTVLSPATKPHCMVVVNCGQQTDPRILKAHLQSVAQLRYDDDKLFLFIFCQGSRPLPAFGSQPTSSTAAAFSAAHTDQLGPYSRAHPILGVLDYFGPEPELRTYPAVGFDGYPVAMAQVYTGYYEYGIHHLPYCVVVKYPLAAPTWTPSDPTRPFSACPNHVSAMHAGVDRRDSLCLALNFWRVFIRLREQDRWNREWQHFGQGVVRGTGPDLRITPLEYELYSQIADLRVNLETFNHALVVDANILLETHCLASFMSRLHSSPLSLATSGMVHDAQLPFHSSDLAWVPPPMAVSMLDQYCNNYVYKTSSMARSGLGVFADVGTEALLLRLRFPDGRLCAAHPLVLGALATMSHPHSLMAGPPGLPTDSSDPLLAEPIMRLETSLLPPMVTRRACLFEIVHVQQHRPRNSWDIDSSSDEESAQQFGSDAAAAHPMPLFVDIPVFDPRATNARRPARDGFALGKSNVLFTHNTNQFLGQALLSLFPEHRLLFDPHAQAFRVHSPNHPETIGTQLTLRRCLTHQIQLLRSSFYTWLYFLKGAVRSPRSHTPSTTLEAVSTRSVSRFPLFRADAKANAPRGSVTWSYRWHRLRLVLVYLYSVLRFVLSPFVVTYLYTIIGIAIFRRTPSDVFILIVVLGCLVVSVGITQLLLCCRTMTRWKQTCGRRMVALVIVPILGIPVLCLLIPWAALWSSDYITYYFDQHASPTDPELSPTRKRSTELPTARFPQRLDPLNLPPSSTTAIVAAEPADFPLSRQDATRDTNHPYLEMGEKGSDDLLSSTGSSAAAVPWAQLPLLTYTEFRHFDKRGTIQSLMFNSQAPLGPSRS